MKIELEIRNPAAAVAGLRQASRVTTASVTDDGSFFANRGMCAGLANQIEAQLPKPRIEEPGPWGVVNAFIATRTASFDWIRKGDRWHCIDKPLDARPWRDLENPALVREGVS